MHQVIAGALLLASSMSFAQEAALLRIIHPLVDDPCSANLFLNGQPAGRLASGGMLELRLPPGDSSLSVARSGPANRCGSALPGPPQSFLLNPGELRQLEVRRDSGGYFLAPSPSSARP